MRKKEMMRKNRLQMKGCTSQGCLPANFLPVHSKQQKL